MNNNYHFFSLKTLKIVLQRIFGKFILLQGIQRHTILKETTGRHLYPKLKLVIIIFYPCYMQNNFNLMAS